MPLSEKDKRRPGFLGGASVVLADGQAWVLPRPVVVFRPSDNESGFEVRAKLGDDGTFSKAFDAQEQATVDNDVIRLQLAMGKALLLANYDLTNDEVADLLEFSYQKNSKSEGARIRREVMAVATGQGEELPDVGGE